MQMGKHGLVRITSKPYATLLHAFYCEIAGHDVVWFVKESP